MASELCPDQRTDAHVEPLPPRPERESEAMSRLFFILSVEILSSGNGRNSTIFLQPYLLILADERSTTAFIPDSHSPLLAPGPFALFQACLQLWLRRRFCQSSKLYLPKLSDIPLTLSSSVILRTRNPETCQYSRRQQSTAGTEV